MDRKLDQIDHRILEELQRNGRISMVDLANRVNLTKTPCTERVRRLERDGIINGYHAKIAPDYFGLDQLTVVQVSLVNTGREAFDAFQRAIETIPEVETCLMVAGNFDYLLLVRTRDMNHFRLVLGEKFSKMSYVSQTHSFAAIELVKDDRSINLTVADRNY